MQILLSGISGIGKTTMAKHISELYGIPFIDGSSKVLWDKLGIVSHNDLIDRCNRDPKFAIDFQFRLLEYRRELMQKNSSFVTDRSPLDNLVYFLLQVSFNTNQLQTADYIRECQMSYPTQYIHLHFGYSYKMAAENDLEHDSARITNAYYQLMVNNLFNMCIEKDYLEIRSFDKIETWDWEKRVIWVNQKIVNKYGKNNSTGLF